MKTDIKYLVETTFKVVENAVRFGIAFSDGNTLGMGVYAIAMGVDLYLLVMAVNDYWHISKMEDEVNIMLYNRDSFLERIRRHHIIIYK